MVGIRVGRDYLVLVTKSPFLFMRIMSQSGDQDGRKTLTAAILQAKTRTRLSLQKCGFKKEDSDDRQSYAALRR